MVETRCGLSHAEGGDNFGYTMTLGENRWEEPLGKEREVDHTLRPQPFSAKVPNLFGWPLGPLPHRLFQREQELHFQDFPRDGITWDHMGSSEIFNGFGEVKLEDPLLRPSERCTKP